MSKVIRINIKLKKEDSRAVIDCMTSLPTGIRLVSQAELKRSHRFIFTVTRYQLIPKLFSKIRKSVKNKYPIMPTNVNKRKLTELQTK